MNQRCGNGSIERLYNEIRPLHVLLNDQTLVCFLPGTKTFLSHSDIARLLDFPVAKDNHSIFQNIPVLSPENSGNGLVTLGNHSSVRHPSAFFLLVLQTSKPASVAMTRWLTREVAPKAAIFKAPLAAVTDDMELKKMIGRHKSRMTGQILVNLEIVKTGERKSSPDVDEVEIPIEGGESCQKT